MFLIHDKDDLLISNFLFRVHKNGMNNPKACEDTPAPTAKPEESPGPAKRKSKERESSVEVVGKKTKKVKKTPKTKKGPDYA